ncbi:MAG: SEC-C metal-binding domain-containing protein, partial [Chloroflexota bacterium]
FAAVAKEVKRLNGEGRPILIGTTSIDKSEYLSDLLTRSGVNHQVLNAKNHEREAAIIAQAGRLGATTVATNMAGRGVDIILGGTVDGRSPEDWQHEHNAVVELGGLHIVGTEHHEARRIDNQLRGRAGRQGDPGSSIFYASLEDEVMRRFGGERVRGLMQWAGMDDETPIQHSMVSKSITNAQVQTEGYHFDIRKHLVEYDDVLNKHREVIYSERRKILSGADLKSNILSMVEEELRLLVDSHRGDEDGELDLQALLQDLSSIFPEPEQALAGSREDGHPVPDRLVSYAEELYDRREQEMGADNMRLAERILMLRTIDSLWKEHLTAVDHVRRGIGLRAAGQQNPLVVYKQEAHTLFEGLLAGIRHDVVRGIYRVGVKRDSPPRRRPQPVAAGRKVGRNEPCPCGSGKKYKHCCGT